MNKQRYIRQTGLEQFGVDGQLKLTNSRVLVVGLGGLGLPALQYLNAMGAGTLGLMDNDKVELHNLQRQVLYTEKDIGRSKLKVALERLSAQNTETQFKTYPNFLTPQNALDIIAEYDLVLDATDNFETRYLINDACVLLNKPFVYGALHGFEGQVSVFNYKQGPTYRCLFPKQPKAHEMPNCDENGVLGVIPGIIGNLQALEVVKVLTGVGEVLSGQLLLFDGLTQSSRKIQFPAKPESRRITELQESYGTTFCGNGIPSISTEELQKLLEEKVQLIDVRTSEEFETYHLPKSVLIPLQELEANAAKINFSIPVYLICQSGKRSETAVQLLQEKYPESSLFSILGGLNQYMATCS